MKMLWSALRDQPVAAAIGGLLIVAVIVALIFAAKQYGDWEEWCVNEMNGRIESDTRTSTGVGANGQTTTVTDTTHYCLNDDGGIIDIR